MITRKPILQIEPLPPFILSPPSLGEAAKKFLFFSGQSKNRGRFFLTKFVAVENLDIFCLRRHIQILILVY